MIESAADNLSKIYYSHSRKFWKSRSKRENVFIFLVGELLAASRFVYFLYLLDSLHWSLRSDLMKTKQFRTWTSGRQIIWKWREKVICRKNFKLNTVLILGSAPDWWVINDDPLRYVRGQICIWKSFGFSHSRWVYKFCLNDTF